MIAIRSVSDAAGWLEHLIDVEKRPDFRYERLGLDAIRALLTRIGDPQRDLRVIHIAGSKGKGSTALFAEAIGVAAGRSVGTFTSPHLSSWTERFRIDGREVDDARLVAAVAALRPHVEALRTGAPECVPTWFDVTTAVALQLFRGAGVDIAILEVGLGGRLDSTNAVDPAVTCVTQIELEHTALLGTTLAQIAREKAGILKPGVPAVIGALPSEARDVVAARASELCVHADWLGRDFRATRRRSNLYGQSVLLEDGPLCVDVDLPVLGAHQADNAALALACVRRAGLIPDSEIADAARRGLRRVRLPGRIEVLGRRPGLIVDAAHTQTSARALADALAAWPSQRTRLVLSVSVGKAIAEILEALLPHASEVTVTRAEPTRSLEPEAVAAAVRAADPAMPLRVVPNPFLAVRAAREDLGPDDLLCATGSVYLAGIARRILRESPVSGHVAVSRRHGDAVGGS